MINGPLGITAIKDGSQITFITRLPDGTPLTYRPSSGTQAYFITEPNGNVSYLVDPFGYAVGAYQYSPYGKTTVGGGISAFNPFRWMGEYQETNANLTPGHYKLGARFYNTNGHFTQPDAMGGNLGDPRSMTAYNYAGGDPINRNDVSGYSAKETLTKMATSCISGASAASFVTAGAFVMVAPPVGMTYGAMAALGGVGGCAGGVMLRGLESKGKKWAGKLADTVDVLDEVRGQDPF